MGRMEQKKFYNIKQYLNGNWVDLGDFPVNDDVIDKLNDTELLESISDVILNNSKLWFGLSATSGIVFHPNSGPVKLEIISDTPF